MQSQIKHSHSLIGASSMHRWAECPASVRMSKGMPNTSSKYAEEGTQAHELAAAILNKEPVNVDLYPEGMLEAVQVYVEAVRADFGAADFAGTVQIEHSFDLSELHPGLYGTADCVIYNSATKLLRVYDYKHGQGMAVEVENNEQLKYYGLGALLSTNYPCEFVELVIVQPRCVHPAGPIRRHKFPSIELLEFAADLVEAAKRTEDPKAPFKSGEHCRFCPAAAVCPELFGRAKSVAMKEFSPVKSYVPADLKEALMWADKLKGWIKSVEEFAYQEAQKGRVPPGYKLVQTRATRKWEDINAAAKTLENHVLDSEVRHLYTDPELKTPAQIEKALGKKIKDLVATLTVSVSSGTKLVPENEPGEAIKLDAQSEFSAITH